MSVAKNMGFTLIEILVVICIIAILAALLLPAMMGALCSSKTTTANKVVYELSKALDNYYNDYGAYPPTDITGDKCPCPVHKSPPSTYASASMVSALKQNVLNEPTANNLQYYNFNTADLDPSGNLYSHTTPTDIFSYKENADVATGSKTTAHNPYKYDIYAGDCNGAQATKVKNW